MNESRPVQRGWEAGWWALASAIAVTALVLGVVGLFLPARGASSATKTVAGPPQTASVSLTEFAVTPSSITIDPSRPLQLSVHNSGTMVHDLLLEGTRGTKMLAPGASETVDLGVIDHDTTAWCTVSGHKESGMVLAIHVSGGAGSAAGPTATTGASGTSGTGGAASTKDAVIDPNAKPGPDWKAFDPTLRAAPGATEHAVTFHVTEKVLEVAPGVTQQMWTFNGTVPGPILRGHVGDVFTVTLINDGTMGHSIDFHASKVAPNVEMRTLQPGQSLVYQFKADYAGIWMYHCGTAPALDHIGNGMYGAVVVDPPNLPAVDTELVMVQSELYLGPQGQPGDFAKMQAFTPDAVVFNGYYNQYRLAPIGVEAGKRIRVWVIDDGPSENSSFHIVGTIFDTVFKEGRYELAANNPTHGGAQTLDLQPAQGGFVEFTFAQPGVYTMVTHKFANVGKGAVGTFEARAPAGT